MISRTTATTATDDTTPWGREDAIALILFAIYWLAFVAASPAPMQESLVDDAYIFQRIVDNLWVAHVWTYNTNELVNPVTAPFYALLLVGAKAFGFMAPTTIAVVYLVGLLALGFGVYGGLRHRGRAVALTMAILISSAHIPVESWGMETSVFLACLVLSSLAYVRGMYICSGVLCAFAALSRPEGFALVGILVGLHFIEARVILWRLILTFLMLVTPWLIYSYLTFGHLLPNSVAVKAVQHNIGWFKTQPSWLVYFLSQPKLLWITYPLALLGFYDAIHQVSYQSRFVLLLVAFGLLQVAAYSLMNAPVGYFWYMAPGNLALDMLIVFGAFKAFGWVSDRMAWVQRRIPMQDRRLILSSAMVLLSVSKLGMSPMKLIKPYRLGEEYRQAGEWINSHTPRDNVVAAAEIGYLGFYSQRQIRDIHGLIHPNALPFLKMEEWDWWFKSDTPEVIVTHLPPWAGEPFGGGWSPRSILDFQDHYIRTAVFGEVQIYQQVLATAE
jgi:hypothetical protein